MPDMLAQDGEGRNNSQSKTSLETVKQLRSISAETSAPNNASCEPRPAGNAQCLATVTEDQTRTHQQVILFGLFGKIFL